MRNVYTDIRAERRYQDKKWGGPAHDDEHGPLAWFRLIREEIREAEMASAGPERRHEMVQIAALAVAALESFDRNTAGL